MKKLFIFLSVSIILNSYAFGQDTVKISTYNLLRYGSGTDRNSDFRKIINYIDADLYITQELTSNAGVSNFLNNVLNFESDNFLSAKFYDNTDIDQALFFNKNIFEIVSTSQITGDPRNIIVYRLRHISTGKSFFVFNLHLKASSGSSNEQRRLQQIIELKNFTQQMNEDHFYVVAGDFNIYSTNEPAYQKFFESTSTGFGKFNDLVKVEGKFNNPEFAEYHTQSPRTSQFGGGATGGMDDRFDYILFSDSLIESNKTFVIDQSYKVIGNDGNHYDMAINIAPNNSVSQDLADALHDASDHLPVSVDIVFSNEVVVPNNYPPVGNDTIFTLNEMPVNNSLVGTVLAEDPEGDELSFSIISGNEENFFNINNNGEIRVAEGSSISFENYKEFILIVEVSDGELKENIQVIITVIENPPLAIENFINKDITIYPNPFNNYLTINTIDEIRDVKLFDTNGKIIFEKSRIKGDFKIKFQNQNQGVYYISFREKNDFYKIRVIKKDL